MVYVVDLNKFMFWGGCEDSGSFNGQLQHIWTCFKSGFGDVYGWVAKQLIFEGLEVMLQKCCSTGDR